MRIIDFISICLSLALQLVAVSLNAQNGNLKGEVIDPNGFAMPGALISIETQQNSAVTDFEGRFTLLDIPEGQYTVLITYLGFADMESSIQILRGSTTNALFSLIPEHIELEGVEVYERFSNRQIKALNKQKNSIHLSNVISMDQLGKFPDANIGDAVKRIAGLNIQVDQGEARDVIIRGLSPELNSVTINGSRIPSAEGDNRNVQLDLIPADMIQSVEISKAITPDKDADALGGAINLITRTSPQGLRISSTLGSGINFIENSRIINGSFLIGNRSKNDRFGWMLATSVYDTEFGSDDVEAEWKDVFTYNTGTTDNEGEAILEEIPVNPYPFILEQQNHVIQRIRRSISLNMDFRLNDRNSLFVKSIYNWRDDRENRANLEYEVLPGEDIEESEFTLLGNSLIRFPTLVSRQLRGGAANRSKTARLEDQRMQNYSIGGTHLIGTSMLDWLASWSRASERSEKERIGEYKAEYSVFNDLSDSRFPFFRPENPDDFDDLQSFLYDEITEENLFTKEEDFNIFTNIEIPTSLIGFSKGIFKTGVRIRFKNKIRENDFSVFDLSNQFPSLANVPSRNYSDPDFLAGSRYQLGIFPTENWLSDLVLANGDLVPSEFLGQNYNTSEDVFAVYSQFEQPLSPKLDALAGIRMEYTKTNATANQIIDEDTPAGRETERGDYTNIMPGIHLKYKSAPSSIWRFGWSNTLARPNYVDLVPTVDIIFEDREIFAGNPELRAVTSMNFDLAYEFYFESAGLVSTGIFYKRIHDFIYTFKGTTTDDSFGSGTENFDLFRPLNGDDASIFGLEIAFSKKFNDREGVLRNFSLDANYTYLSSRASGVRNEDGILREDIELPRTSPHSYNVSLGFDKSRFEARISAHYSDAYLDEIGRNSFEDIYYDEQFFLDFNTSYRFLTNWTIYAALNNLTNRPLRLYQGRKSLTNQVEFYGRRFTFGLKYEFFRKKEEK